MSYYRSCLQRQLYANGPDKTLLSKATQSSGAVESLLEEFPDAKFITIIRHPYSRWRRMSACFIRSGARIRPTLRRTARSRSLMRGWP